MRRAAWKRRLSQPATRLVTVAGLVFALVAAQFVLLIAGGAAADREASHAAELSVEYLADISQERVLNSASAVDHLVHNTTRLLRVTQPDTEEIVRVLRAELENVVAASALSVTYASGDFVELRRSPLDPRGYLAYVVEYGEETVATRYEVEYDADLNEVSRRWSHLAFGTTRTPSYVGASTASQVVWTGPSYDPVSDRDVVRASLMARDRNGAQVMVIAANLALAPLQRSLSTLPSGSDGRISVLASDGTVIAAPWSAVRIPSDRPQQPFNLTPDPGESIAPLTNEAFGIGDSYTTVERVIDDRGLDWVVKVEASAAGLNGGFGRLRSTLDGVIGGLMILTIALGYLLATMWRPMMAMREGAERDALTGLYNRRHVDAAAESLLKFADRTDTRAAFVMMDLDEFKSLNDELGHVDGDRALAAVGAYLSKQMRAGDLAARWGGDEFLLVLMLRVEDDPKGVIERIRRGAADALSEMFPARSDLGVTAGYATTDVVGDDVGVLIASADRALVRGKAVAKGDTYALGPRT